MKRAHSNKRTTERVSGKQSICVKDARPLLILKYIKKNKKTEAQGQGYGIRFYRSCQECIDEKSLHPNPARLHILTTTQRNHVTAKQTRHRTLIPRMHVALNDTEISAHKHSNALFRSLNHNVQHLALQQTQQLEVNKG